MNYIENIEQQSIHLLTTSSK